MLVGWVLVFLIVARRAHRVYSCRSVGDDFRFPGKMTVLLFILGGFFHHRVIAFSGARGKAQKPMPQLLRSSEGGTVGTRKCTLLDSRHSRPHHLLLRVLARGPHILYLFCVPVPDLSP